MEAGRGSAGGRSAGGQLDLLLLSTLATAGEAHGYALISALRDRSGGSFELAEGSIYPAFQRLERSGLVAGRWDASTARPRRVYRLTRAGHRALAAKRDEWTAFAASVDRVIGLAPA